MPRDRLTIRALGVAALLVAVLGLGMFFGAPNTAVAQEDPTTTVAQDNSTDTTVVEDDSTDGTVDESTDESEERDAAARGDHDCGDRSDGGSSEESSSSDA